MIKTVFASTLLSSFFLIIQTTWLKNGLFWGVIPDLVLLVVVWVAYSNRDNQGVFTGFFSGLICDLLSSSPFGYSAFIYIAPAYIASFLKNIVAMDGFFIPVIMGFSCTIVKGLASELLLLLFGAGNLNAYSFSDLHFWVEAVLNGAIAPLLFFALKKAKRVFVTRRVTE
jgi:rod shape-determining protein MreD